ncbi:hypothetical protein DDD63_06170 [Actinobaculum sp. 313]|nr:hypothetical protein DDD63_06170 [Actinobaculum sp. 313]
MFTNRGPSHLGNSNEGGTCEASNQRCRCHYTTARLEHQAPYSGVITTSGQQWGWHGTEAKTKWKAFNPNLPSGGIGRARTYYGK